MSVTNTDMNDAGTKNNKKKLAKNNHVLQKLRRFSTQMPPTGLELINDDGENKQETTGGQRIRCCLKGVAKKNKMEAG